MQKILISIDVLLNEAFEGLEEETNCFGAISILIPPGEDPLDPVGGLTMSDILSNLARIRSKQLLISSVPTLMLCCCIMLTNPYPVQVTVPVCPLLTLLGRALMADGSLCQGLLPFTTILQHESICFVLPILHLYSLDLFTAIIKGVHSQLLPHAADIVQLLMEYFRRCALPTLRIKVYSIIRMLLISMGVGIALYIAQEVVSNAFGDLDSVAYGNGRESSSEYSNPEALLQPSNRERKQDTTAGSLGEDLDGVGLEVEILKEDPTLTSLKIAALESLEALLTVGGALKCEHLRSDVDLLLINVATNAFDVKWTNDEDSDFLSLNEPTSTSIELQLAALRALLASLLSPASVWPCYLNQGLELFRKGKQEMGTKVAEFCAHALLALELLMHPRYLSMMDSPPVSQSYFNEGINCGVSENLCSGGQENDAPQFQLLQVWTIFLIPMITCMTVGSVIATRLMLPLAIPMRTFKILKDFPRQMSSKPLKIFTQKTVPWIVHLVSKFQKKKIRDKKSVSIWRWEEIVTRLMLNQRNFLIPCQLKISRFLLKLVRVLNSRVGRKFQTVVHLILPAKK